MYYVASISSTWKIDTDAAHFNQSNLPLGRSFLMQRSTVISANPFCVSAGACGSEMWGVV